MGIFIENDHEGIRTEAMLGATTMLISFGGIAGGLVVAPFEFGGVISEIKAHKVFVRDQYQAWYHQGVQGSENSLGALYARLVDIRDEMQPRRVVTIGNSCGGFAALLFGSLMGAAQVHAFAPQTYIGPWRRLFTRDFRWSREMLRLHLLVRPKCRCYDLRPVLTLTDANCHIYYSLSDAMDVRHAERLVSVTGVQLHPYEMGGHELVRQMRDSGELARIVEAAIDQ